MYVKSKGGDAGHRQIMMMRVAENILEQGERVMLPHRVLVPTSY